MRKNSCEKFNNDFLDTHSCETLFKKYGPWPVMQKERVEMGIYIKYTIANQMNGHLSHRKSNDKEKLSCSSIFTHISKHTLGSYVLKSHSAS